MADKSLAEAAAQDLAGHFRYRIVTGQFCRPKPLKIEAQKRLVD